MSFSPDNDPYRHRIDFCPQRPQCPFRHLLRQNHTSWAKRRVRPFRGIHTKDVDKECFFRYAPFPPARTDTVHGWYIHLLGCSVQLCTILVDGWYIHMHPPYLCLVHTHIPTCVPFWYMHVSSIYKGWVDGCISDIPTIPDTGLVQV